MRDELRHVPDGTREGGSLKVDKPDEPIVANENVCRPQVTVADGPAIGSGDGVLEKERCRKLCCLRQQVQPRQCYGGVRLVDNGFDSPPDPACPVGGSRWQCVKTRRKRAPKRLERLKTPQAVVHFRKRTSDIGDERK